MWIRSPVAMPRFLVLGSQGRRLRPRALQCGFLALSMVASAGCRDTAVGRDPDGQGRARLQVACTVGMITDVVRNIGGEHVNVTGLMGPGVDPHTYKATPRDRRILGDADLILYCGLHLEGRMADLFVQLARTKPVVAVTETMDETRLREPPEFAGHYDPHVWFDVSLWRVAAERIRDALIEHRPQHQADFQKRAVQYLAELDELHQYCRSRLAQIPTERRLLITSHDAFGYFGRAYGLEVLAIQGISTESEPGVKKINDLVDILTARQVPAVFIESSVNPRYIEALVQGCAGRNHPVRIAGELFSDAMGKDGTPEGTYIGMIRHNVDAIVAALK